MEHKGNLIVRGKIISDGTTPEDSADLATKGYVDAAVGPGFYGVNFRETDGNPPAFRNDTIYFDSESFYLHPNSVGKPVLSFRGSSGGGVTDHGNLTGLSDDDHPQYALLAANKNRFAGQIDAEAFYLYVGLEISDDTAGGVTISAPGQIYVHSDAAVLIEAFTNAALYTIPAPDGTAPGTLSLSTGDSAGSDNASAVNITSGSAGGTGLGAHVNINSGGSTGSHAGDVNLTGGNAGGSGRGGDIFLTAGTSVSGAAGGVTISAGTGGFTVDAAQHTLSTGPLSLSSQKITDLAAPTDDNDAARFIDVKNYAGGFYGINFRETDDNPPGFRNDTIYFDSNDFYLSPNSVGKPVLSFRGSSGGSGTALTVQDEDGTPTVSNVSTIRFTNSTVTDNGGGDVSVAVTAGGGGIATLTVGADSFGSQTTLGFNASDFYLSGGATSKVLNLRNDVDVFQGQVPQPTLENYFVIPTAQHNYTVVSAELDSESGTATCAFYIVSASNRQLPGRYISGMDPISVSSSRQIVSAGNTALNPNTMVIGDRLVLSVYGTSAARHVTYTVKVRKT